jgi:hypothetical protein
MSVLSDFVLAKDQRSILGQPLDRLEARGITDIELQSLDEIMTRREDAFPEDVDVGASVAEVLVFAVSDELVAKLAGAPAGSLAEVAATWSETEELEGSDPAVLATLLTGLAAMAKKVATAKARIYLIVRG